MAYSFSVSNISISLSSVLVKEIDQATDVAVDHSITTYKTYDAEGNVADEVTETEDIVFTTTFIEAGYDLTLNVGTYYDIVLSQAGPQGSTGFSLTLANCRITGYKVTQRQGEFVTSELTFSKAGKITDGAGTTTTKQLVKFGNGTDELYIGDNASLDISYEGNVSEYIIPTALGIGVRSTSEMGGGKINITVNAYVKKNHRLEVEQYLLNLFANLRTSSGTLTVTYGSTTYTVSGVTFASGAMSSGSGKYSNFTCTFMKSAYS